MNGMRGGAACSSACSSPARGRARARGAAGSLRSTGGAKGNMRSAGRQAAGLAGLGVGVARRGAGASRGAGVVAMAAKGGNNEMKSFMTYLSTAPVLIMVVG